MVDDAVISKEASLMFQNVAGFEPVNNNLLHWKGYARDLNNQPVEIELKVPQDYPYLKPQVNVLTQSGAEIPLRTRKMSRWRPDYYLFQVANEALKLVSEAAYASTPATSKQETKQSDEQLQMLQRQKSNLQGIIDSKRSELQMIRSTPANTSSNHDINQVLEDSIFDLEMDLAALEDDYDRLEIDGSEFAKNFIDMRKRILMLQSAQ